MKNPMTPKFATFCLMGFLSAGPACGQLVEVQSDIDNDGKLAKVFLASKADVDQTWNWRLGVDADFMSLKALIEIAQKHVKPPQKNYRMFGLMDVGWRQIGEGWMMTAHFAFFPDPPIRDGQINVPVHLLPNGALVTTQTRPLTKAEKEIIGVAPPASKENKVGEDPFVDSR